MPHILIAGKLHPAGLALLDATAGVTYTHVEEISEASYQDHLEQADAMVIRTQPMTAASVAKAARLQIVSRHGVGYDAVDVAALNARGIPLCIVGDVNSVSVAEHAMMQILACAKQLIRSDRAVRGLGLAQQAGTERDFRQDAAHHRLWPDRAASGNHGFGFRDEDSGP